MGFDQAQACAAIHLNNFTMRHHAGPQTPDEGQKAAAFEVQQDSQIGYRVQQETKPQSLGFAIAGSPVGVAAWIIDKFNTWSDTSGDDVESAHTKDALLADIMVYLVTNSFATASWIYAGRETEGVRLISTDDSRARCQLPALSSRKSCSPGYNRAMSTASIISYAGLNSHAAATLPRWRRRRCWSRI